MPNIRFDRVSLSIAHAMNRLPPTHNVSERTQKTMPVWSKDRNGTKYLHKMVNNGEKRNMERLFLPTYCTPSLAFEVRYRDSKRMLQTAV